VRVIVIKECVNKQPGRPHRSAPVKTIDYHTILIDNVQTYEKTSSYPNNMSFYLPVKAF